MRGFIFFIGFFLVFSFAFASEGFIDVSVENSKVKQGDFLAFDVVVNKTNGDNEYAFFDYWIEDLTNKRWSIDSGQIYLLEAPNVQNFKREVYVLSNQGTGVYFLKFSFKFNEDATPLTVFERFFVVPREEDSKFLEVIDAPKEFLIQKGKKSDFSIKVKNLDSKEQTVLLFIQGLDEEFYSVKEYKLKPSNIDFLNFSIELPENFEEERISVVVKVIGSSQSSDSFASEFVVVEDLKSLLTSQSESFEMLLVEKKSFSIMKNQEGFNTALLDDEIASLSEKILSFKSLIEEENFVSALFVKQEVESGFSFLETLKLKEVRNDNVVNALELFLLIAGNTVFILFIVYYLNRKNNARLEKTLNIYSTEIINLVRRETQSPGAILKLKKGVDLESYISRNVKRSLNEQDVRVIREKVDRTKALLESIEIEHKNGEIGNETYEEIKTKSEERLKALEDKLEENSSKKSEGKGGSKEEKPLKLNKSLSKMGVGVKKLFNSFGKKTKIEGLKSKIEDQKIIKEK